MKYAIPTLFALLIIVCVPLCYSYRVQNNKLLNFNISTIRSIETEALYRQNAGGDKASITYLDSLTYNARQDSSNVYFHFFSTLKTILDSKKTTEQKISDLLNITNKRSFENLHPYNRYKTRQELTTLLQNEKNYEAAIEQNILSIKHIENKANEYNLELARLYHNLALLFLKTPEYLTKVEGAFIEAHKLYAEAGSYDNSALMLYDLSHLKFLSKQYDLSNQYAYQSIEEYKKFSADVNYPWLYYYPNLLANYQKLNKIDSAYSIYKLAKAAYQTKRITDISYAGFLSESLEYIVALKDYDEAEKNIAYILSVTKKFSCSDDLIQTIYCLVYKAKSTIARNKNEKKQERVCLEQLLDYSSCSNKGDYYFNAFYNETINRLIELDSAAGNSQQLVQWYGKKLEFIKKDEKQNEVYLKHLNFWSNLNDYVVEQEINAQNEKFATEKTRMVLISIFSILTLLGLKTIFDLYKKTKFRQQELTIKEEKLKSSD